MGLSINVIQVVLLLLLPRRMFHHCNYYTVAALYGYLVYLTDWWSGSSFTVYSSNQFHEKLKNRNFRERQLVLVNHHTELDWLYCWQLADRGGLVGGCRALAKKVLQYAPVIGWSSFMSGDVFISRSFEKDCKVVEAKVEAMEYQPIPTWLFLFPEGTRINSEKLKASQEFALSRGLPKLEHHLTPRVKGFSLIVPHLKGGLLDLTFVQGPGGVEPTLNSVLMGRSVDTRVFVREFALSQIPKGQKEAGEWLMELWRSKDEIKAAYLADDWERLAQLGEFVVRESPRRMWSLVFSILVQVAILGPLLYLLIQGGTYTWCIALVCLVVAWIGLEKFTGVTKIKEGV